LQQVCDGTLAGQVALLPNATGQTRRGEREIAVTAIRFRGASTALIWTGLFGSVFFMTCFPACLRYCGATVLQLRLRSQPRPATPADLTY